MQERDPDNSTLTRAQRGGGKAFATIPPSLPIIIGVKADENDSKKENLQRIKDFRAWRAMLELEALTCYVSSEIEVQQLVGKEMRIIFEAPNCTIRRYAE